MSTSKTQRIVSLVLALVFLISSVGMVAYYVLSSKQSEKDQAALQEQLNNQVNNKQEAKLQGTNLQNFQPVESVASLQIADTVAGTGDEVKAGDTVTVNYTGALAKTGVIFESSYDSGQTATFGLNQVIPGWTQGLPGMKVGGTRRLLIPAAMAYGSQSNAKIPANSDLVFDVQLIKINK
jgi:FKBP-type peptidyl-prolyl cis-trans isomerase